MKTLQEILSNLIKAYKSSFPSGFYGITPEALDVFESKILAHFNSQEINESNFLMPVGKNAYIRYNNMNYYSLLEGCYDEELATSHSDEQKIENLLDWLIGRSEEV